MTEKRKLKRTGKSEYTLTIDNKDKKEHFVKVHSKKDLKDTYNDMLTENRKALETQLNQAKARLRKLDVEDSPELRGLMDNLKKIQQLQQKEQLETQIKQMEKDLATTKQHMKEIESVLPELKRNN